MTTDVLLSLGSNIAPLDHLRAAVVALAELGEIVAVSPVYASRAVGPAGQPHFLNAAVWLRTDLAASDLKGRLRQIEAGLGRVRVPGDKYAPRTIDLDISLYGDAVLELEGRHIPDPDLVRYTHIAVPLADIAPLWCHPQDGRTLDEIATGLSADGLARQEGALWSPQPNLERIDPCPR